MSISYLVCNSHQIQRLTELEREVLDRTEYVVTCNGFPSNWRTAGFRPTHWVWGDTETDQKCEALGKQLDAIHQDAELRERLRNLYVCIETPAAVGVVVNSELPITLYRRGHWGDETQTFAKSLYEPLWHTTTGLDLLNLTMILKPDTEIRLIGCQRGGHDGYFWDGPWWDSDPEVFFARPMWDAFQKAYDTGVRILDCNHEHHPTYADQYSIPRGTLL